MIFCQGRKELRVGDNGCIDGIIGIGEPGGRLELSCCMVARDESTRIADAISSVRDLADEILVVDTGSIDDTADIAGRLGARILRGAPVEDLSCARNSAISRARGKWILVLDADEVLDRRYHKTIEKILASGEGLAFAIEQRTWTSCRDTYGWIPSAGREHGSRGMPGFVSTDQVRLFRRDSGAFFEGAVFESVDGSLSRRSVRVLRADGAVIDHYGRVEDEGRMRRLYDLYSKAGIGPMPARGNLPYIFELAEQMTGMGEAVDALPLIRAGLRIDPQSWRLVDLEGLARLSGKDRQGAICCFRAALELGADRAEPFNNLEIGRAHV